MPRTPQFITAARLDRHRGRSRWLVPAAIGVLAIVTVALILLAFGVLIGLIRF